MIKNEYLIMYNTQYINVKKEKEFKYLEEINDKELNKVKNNYIFIDLRKRTLLQMLDNNKSKYLSYSNHQRIKEIHRNNNKNNYYI
jgi:hypothetical protein